MISDDSSSDGGDSDSDDEKNLLAQTADILKDLENGNRGANDHASTERGGCEDDEVVEDVKKVDHESEPEADSSSAGDMATADEDATDAGHSIPEEEEEAADDRAAKLGDAKSFGPSPSLLVEPSNNKQLNSVSTCSELSEDEFQDVECGEEANQEKEAPRNVAAHIYYLVHFRFYIPGYIRS